MRRVAMSMLLLAVAGCSSAATQEDDWSAYDSLHIQERDLEIPFQSGPQTNLSVRVPHGFIKVLLDPEQRVNAKIDIYVSTGGDDEEHAQERSPNVRVHHRYEGHNLMIWTEFPDGVHSGDYTSLEIRLPVSPSAIRLESPTGTAVVSNMNCPLELLTGNARVLHHRGDITYTSEYWDSRCFLFNHTGSAAISVRQSIVVEASALSPGPYNLTCHDDIRLTVGEAFLGELWLSENGPRQLLAGTPNESRPRHEELADGEDSVRVYRVLSFGQGPRSVLTTSRSTFDRIIFHRYSN